MNYLLDTHTLIWAIADSKKLSKRAKELIEDSSCHILVSAISFWEISLKHSIGKLQLGSISPEDFPILCQKMDFEVLSIDPDTCSTYHFLEAKYHKDPFDRMLLWLAKSQNFSIISKDENLKLYASEGLSIVW